MDTSDKSHVQEMFGNIAPRYDLMNRLMTFGRDQYWRKFVVEKAQISDNGMVLDIATGTGDIAFEIRRQKRDAQIIAADFALPMMVVGKNRKWGQDVLWLGADAQNLPLPSSTFDAVVSGFLLRNVPDINRTLGEQWRILKPGGRIVTLDTTPPSHNLLRPLINLHFKFIIPVMGRLITGDSSAYRYLPESTLSFTSADELSNRFEDAGFKDVGYRRFMMGTIAVHWAAKPA
ncbi:MAG: ubiquinone/menaquinone biosynthesis methyltransferase [Chloroflexi bacterium]|nr:ubiquinone/menaquinone biosynthesis methyltransferase [Chloroflexota bacterium]